MDENYYRSRIIKCVLDKALAKELKIFFQMTGRDIQEEVKKINVDNFDIVDFVLLENDFER